MDKTTFISKYGKDHIIVYIGTDLQMKMNPKPTTPGKILAPPDTSAVYIDGMNYGSANRPFSCFEVDPGTHGVEINAMFGKKRAATDPVPVRVRDTSVMIAFKAIECLSGIYWEIKQFTDIDEFLKETGESLRAL